MNKFWPQRISIRVAGAVCFAVVGLAVTACGSEDSEGDGTTAPQMATSTGTAQENIVETAVGAGSFTKLTSLLERAGLAETLSGKGPYTVFAPTDEAFAAVPKETLDDLAADPDMLRAILLYHVVEGEARATDVASMSSAETLNGESVRLRSNDGVVRVDAARVVKADVTASNGVIHIIDEVLIPSS